jgi:hypothetical protein
MLEASDDVVPLLAKELADRTRDEIAPTAASAAMSTLGSSM